MCAELGIKLTLKGDDDDPLQVDAPEGALTVSIRETLTAHKTEIVAALKSKSRKPQPQILSRDSDEAVIRDPASPTANSPEATPLILEQRLEEARRRAVEERQLAAERARVLAAEATQRLAELESVKTQAE